MEAIRHGDRVRIHYTSRSIEGSVIETSNQREPFEFTAGSGEVIPAVSHGVIGMRPGQRKTLTADSERAFSRHSPELVRTIPRWLLPEQTAAGDQLTARFEKSLIDVWVQRLTPSEAFLDANHPLSGETLLIDVEIVGPATR